MNKPRKPSGILKGELNEATAKEVDREIERMFYENTDDLTCNSNFDRYKVRPIKT